MSASEKCGGVMGWVSYYCNTPPLFMTTPVHLQLAKFGKNNCSLLQGGGHILGLGSGAKHVTRRPFVHQTYTLFSILL